jgi:hypothetical protein
MDLDWLERPPLVFEGSAAEIWQRLDGTRDEGDIVIELAELYGEDRLLIEPAVTAFLGELVERGLLERVPRE